MAYFQMDDGTDTELRVFKVGTAAFGLYARCGVWVARNLTDGFIPAEVAASYGTREWIDKLVASGLWTLEDGGFGMPDYLGKHDNKTAVEVRKRRADAAARQAKMRENRKRRQASNMSPGESRVTHAGTHGVTHTTQSDPPPKGGEEGGAPLRGGGAPPSKPNPTHRLTTGRVVCATHHQELPCISCASDAKALGTDDLDQRPPMPAAPPDRPADTASIQLRAELAAARHTLHTSGNPDHWLDTARDTLIRAGTPPDQVSATDTLLLAVDLCRAADLATRPDPTTGPS